eukprot:605301-Prorocentrum_minimum.AAC.1
MYARLGQHKAHNRPHLLMFGPPARVREHLTDNRHNKLATNMKVALISCGTAAQQAPAGSSLGLDPAPSPEINGLNFGNWRPQLPVSNLDSVSG